MKPPASNPIRSGDLLRGSLAVLVLLSSLAITAAQPIVIQRPGMPGPMPGQPSTPPPSGSPSSGSSSSSSTAGGATIPSEPLTGASTNTNGIQLSFQGANVDMIVQWLSENTRKTVVKHPQVQCNVTITSSRPVSPREAVNIVYRALALEGFTVVEFSNSILIVPEGKEPRMNPELLRDGSEEIPDGRQRLAKVFRLTNVQASEIREKIRSALSDKATIDIDERANQIIIADYNDNIRVVGQLIEALDSERPEDIAIRIRPLRHMNSQELVKALLPLYQKMNQKTPKDTVDLVADDRSGSLMVLSSEANFQALDRVIRVLDTEDAQEKTMRTFELKNADAQDVAKQLQDLSQTQGAGSRPIYYFGNAPTPDTRKMSVVSDRRRNAVIVQAPPAQIDGIAKMIAELDQPIADDSLAPRIYKLKYVSAVDIVDVLNELFLKKQQTRSYWWDPWSDFDSGSSSGQDAGRLYGKVRITSEPYANAIIVTANSKENLTVVEEVLAQLDVPSDAGESTWRIPLRFAKASTVAKSVNILFARQGSPPVNQQRQQQQQGGGGNQQQPQRTGANQTGFDLERESQEEGYYPWLGGPPDTARTPDGRSPRPVSDLVGRVRAVPDDRGNALLVSASMHFYPQIIRLIEDMDSPTDQVLIEARLVEVSSNFMDKLGVRWSPDGRQFTADDLDNAALIKAGGEYRQGFGGTTIVNNPGTGAGAALAPFSPANLLAQIRSGVIDSTISLDFLVQFLRKTTDATVLAEPQINIRDNETGRLFVGQQVPIQTQSQDSGSLGLRTSFDYKNVGVILEVTPHINNAGDVELKIHAESSTVVPGVTILGGAVFDTRTFRTDLRAKSGQTLVLGGIIQKQISDTLRKTPVLGSIPGLGWAFKKKDRISQNVELMVFLHPTVVRSTEDARELLDRVNEKAPRMKRWDMDAAPRVGEPEQKSE